LEVVAAEATHGRIHAQLLLAADQCSKRVGRVGYYHDAVERLGPAFGFLANYIGDDVVRDAAHERTEARGIAQLIAGERLECASEGFLDDVVGRVAVAELTQLDDAYA